MKLKTIQWNIGGGFVREATSDSALHTSYTKNGLDGIIALLKKHSPDVITLQETHRNDDTIQTKTIADALGGYYWVNDVYADSHIAEGYKLGQAVISKYPIVGHDFNLFPNPGLAMTHNDVVGKTHDKGLTTVTIQLPEDMTLTVQTLHMFPLRKFGITIDSPEARKILDSVQQIIMKHIRTPLLLQGDFNLNIPSLKTHFPELFDAGIAEIRQNTPTNTRGRAYDHILFDGIRPVSYTVEEDVLTDHFALIAGFDF